MVFLTRFLTRIKAQDLGAHLHRKFIDRLRVYVKSGNGGRGLSKLGGIGGNGGNVIIIAKENLTLKEVYSKNLRKRYNAKNGEPSTRLKLYGDNGADVVIEVPCGVTAYRDSDKMFLGEVNQENDTVVIAKGGEGGRVENNFQAESGETDMVCLDLKLIADVALIGFPNAGKSSLLSLVSRSRPKIANYPFTTLNPQLGIIEYEDKRMISIADLPGIVEGAHFNRGMGHKFLKHLKRTKLSIFIIDINGFELNSRYEARTPFETLLFLNKELEMYDSSLIDKPSILVLNKTDSENAKEKLELFYKKYNTYDDHLNDVEEYWRPTKRIEFAEILETSVKTNVNVDKLCVIVRDLLDKHTLKTAKVEEAVKEIPAYSNSTDDNAKKTNKKKKQENLL